MYHIEFDSGTGILHAKLRGHWSVAVAARYSDELEVRIIEARRSAGCLKLLIDTTEHGAETADVLEYMLQRGAGSTPLPADKVAVCVTSALSRHWARQHNAKGASHLQNTVFSSVASARAWLLDRREPQSSAA